jgi:hypothetical protein
MKVSYSYTILRYVHDIATGEFANVGIVLSAPKAKFLAARCRSTYGRIGKMFPGIDGESLKSHLRHLEHAINVQGTTLAAELELEAWPKNALAAVQSLLPHDDSALQWSALGSGITDAPSTVLERLYERFVTRYEDKVHKHRRTDEEIWRSFKKEFDAREITPHLTSTKITAEEEEVEFAYAWKNAKWHCIEPVSFDLASADSMKEKAHKWLGQLASLEDANESFKVYFVVGAPKAITLKKGYERAVRILKKSKAEVVTEDKAAEFSARVSEDIEAHIKAR